MFVCHLVDPKLEGEKDRTIEEGDIDFELGSAGTCCILVLGVQEYFKCAFHSRRKRIAFKYSLDLQFYALITRLFRSA